MPMQWYPGHMVQARRAIAESILQNDIVIEVLDARMPCASENPFVSELCAGKPGMPRIKVLSKADLADAEVTRAWIDHLESGETAAAAEGPRGAVAAVALRSDQPGEAKARIAALCERLAQPARQRPALHAMIVGIPNVGKSTLINTLMARKVAKVGDEPAVTKGQQLVILKSGMVLSDNPGILWPKIDDDETGLRLALGGALPDRAIDYESVATFGAAYLLNRYPHLLLARYKLARLPASAHDLLVAIGRLRGGLRSHGAVDLHKAADVLIHDFRSGALGRISLEEPSTPRPLP